MFHYFGINLTAIAFPLSESFFPAWPQEGHWSEPMNKHPPEGPLPSLPRHVACTLRRERLDRRLVAGTETQRDEGGIRSGNVWRMLIQNCDVRSIVKVMVKT